MTSEAPEWKAQALKDIEDVFNSPEADRLRKGMAEAYQQALEAAEARGYARAIEEALAIVNDSFPDYEGGCSLQDQAARDLRNTIFYDIRALAQKDGE